MQLKERTGYVIARNTNDDTGRVEYWTGATWSFHKIDAREYKTLQAIDKAKVENTRQASLYCTTA